MLLNYLNKSNLMNSSLMTAFSLIFCSRMVAGQDLGFLPKFDKEILGQASYSTINLGETAIAGFAVHLGGGLFVTPKIIFSGGYLSMTDATGATVLNGFDGSVKWHFFSAGSSIVVLGDGKLMTKRSSFSHYFLLGYRIRELAAKELAPRYSGFNYGYGANWFFGRSFEFESIGNLFLNSEFDVGSLSSPQGGTSKTKNICLGVGTTF
jgi:hypothetical protein